VLAFTAAPPSCNGLSRLKRRYKTCHRIKYGPSRWKLSKSRGVTVLTTRHRQLSASDSVDDAGAGADVQSTSSNGVDLSIGGDQHIDSLRVTRGATFAPYHILQPDAFPWRNHATNIRCANNGPDASDDIVMSLNSALGILTKALTKMADESLKYDAIDSDKKVAGSVVVDLLNQYNSEGATMTSSFSGPVVLRIEQVLSHEVDPLRWLHANTKCVECVEPIAFFADADGEREAASIGTSLMLTDLVFGEGNTTGWRTVSALPPRTEFYGGSRFDSYNEINNKNRRQGSEWQSFGNEMWLLPSVELRSYPKKKQSVLAAHVVFYPSADGSEELWHSIHNALGVLQKLSDATSPEMAPTDLPPVVRRDYNVGGEGGDGQEAFERGVTAALNAFEDDGYSIVGKEEKDEECDSDIVESSEQNLCIDLQKVVLARRADLHVGSSLSGLDLLMALKFGGHKGHLLYLRPPSTTDNNFFGTEHAAEFFGCSPERLFRLSADESNGHSVQTEALAGTRPRGSTPQADRQLLQDLITSEKDRSENVITGDFIEEVFDDMVGLGLLRSREEETNVSRYADERNSKIFGNVQQKDENMFFVRRLRQLQHICRLFEGRLAEGAIASDAIRHLLQNLHPTPALNGYPSAAALEFIRTFESTSFDRGYYGGPFGYVGREAADVSVAIRSALLTCISKSSGSDSQNGLNADAGSTRISIYAGAGIVPGSTVESEWAETSQKLGVLSSIFPPSPITLQESPTPNVAWATAFVEELIRNGVTQFYVCPGSRSTPLTSALAKATRSRIGTVHAISVHDERGAAFRALGYGRRTGHPAAVVTSSGTAVANLYPAVMEAGMDGVPMILLTADRPYESRDTGANQAVDQVKVRMVDLPTCSVMLFIFFVWCCLFSLWAVLP
jgi:isochorismate synthase EntC